VWESPLSTWKPEVDEPHTNPCGKVTDAGGDPATAAGKPTTVGDASTLETSGAEPSRGDVGDPADE
jgi:hypothetical protein